MVWYILDNFFGGTQYTRNVDEAYVFKDVHSVLNILMKEAYLDKAMPIVSGGIKKNIAYFAPLDMDPAKQTLWGRSSEPQLLRGEPYTVEVELFPLVRNFTAYIASPALVGTAFMKNYPNCISDLWTMDAALPFFISKIPSWLPIPTLKRAHAARARLHAAMIDFFTAMERSLDGKEPEPRWKDLSDVSETMWNRCKTWRKTGLTAEQYSPPEISIFWAYVSAIIEDLMSAFY